MMQNVTLLIYLLILSLGISIAIFARLKPNEVAPFSSVLNQILSNRTSRFVLTFIWWWIGWHFMGSPWPVKMR